MLGKSLPEYIFIRLSILGLRSVFPACALYLAREIYLSHSLLSPFNLYALAEVLFYFLVFLPRSSRLQAEAVSAPRLNAEERRALFERCRTCMDGDALSGWFTSASTSTSADKRVKKENMAEWLNWSLFSTTSELAREEWKEEMEYYLSFFDALFGYTLDVGRNRDLGTLRLAVDPVVACHRPLLWYGVVCLVDALTSTALWRMGFRHYNVNEWFTAFPPRPILSLVSDHSSNPGIPYWYRPHNSKDKLPILFLHGIGIGLWTYTDFFRELIDIDPDIGVLALEILPISMHITHPPLPRAQMHSTITRILDAHNLPRVVLMSHSYGTGLSAQILHDPALESRVAATLFVDPIPFLLHHPSVAYNFLYRAPRTANEWQLWYFASRDADVARALGRHFHWFENVLFREELEGKRVAVSVSGRDQVVDGHAVRRYLTGDDVARTYWEKEGLEVLWWPELDHATVFDTRERRKRLVEVVGRFVALE
ncbi:unnamed protein product [Peniophora sp. CBMAI 1063]|nr:unnamed protein product [Peniophora sp. CBMAI 1063]